MLSVTRLSVRHGSSSIVNNFSFDVADGHVLGLYGPSGAGKSTTIHAIFGLLDSTFKVSGGIALNGRDISTLSPEQRSASGMSIVLQCLGLFPHMSAAENVAYPLLRRGMPRREAASQAKRK